MSAYHTLSADQFSFPGLAEKPGDGAPPFGTLFMSGVPTSAGEPGCDVRDRAPHHLSPDPHSMGGLTAAAAYQVPKPVVQKRVGVGSARPGRADAMSDHSSANSEHAVAHSPTRSAWSGSLGRVATGTPSRSPVRGAISGLLNYRGTRCRWTSPFSAHVRA